MTKKGRLLFQDHVPRGTTVRLAQIMTPRSSVHKANTALKVISTKMLYLLTVNFVNIRTPKKFIVITLKFKLWRYHRVISSNDADGMANSVDPDQTVPPGAV